ncbi:protein croquemort-like [Haematobia irritans]|uniref:protein croquemort-like n=1 Tax=Haematobia irritans TaxID=7368 RepID=UPI003F4F8A43
MCCRCCSVRQQKIWVFTLGSIFTALGVILIPFWPSWSEKIVKSMMPLAPNSFIYNRWAVTPIPLYMKFHLYNWTNPEEVNNPNVKPNFEEFGPYVFKDYKVKEDFDWNDPESLVTFYGLRTWTFEPTMSNGSLDDMITVPHFPTTAASRISRKMHPILRKIVNFALNREGGTMAITYSAIEWLFDGFYDDIFDIVWRLHSPLAPLESNHFAWFYGRNNTKDVEGNFTVHTGKKDLKQMGDLKMLNGVNHTGYWEGDCGKINGSTGELWSPGKKWDDPVSVYIYDASRYLNIFPKTNETYRGVEVRRYESTDQTFDSGWIAEDTKCFCVKGNVCPSNGVVDYSPVTFRAPVYISHPHFFMADASYIENTTGLNPDPHKHTTHVLLEPTLGIPLQVKGQILVSLYVEQDEMIDLYRNIAHNFYAPLFGITIEAEITDDFLRLTKFVLNVPSIGRYLGIAFLVIGVIMISVGIYVTKTHKWRGDFYPYDLSETPETSDMKKPNESSNATSPSSEKSATPEKSEENGKTSSDKPIAPEKSEENEHKPSGKQVTPEKSEENEQKPLEKQTTPEKSEENDQTSSEKQLAPEKSEENDQTSSEKQIAPEKSEETKKTE